MLRLAPNDDKIAAIVQHFGYDAGDYDDLLGAGLSMIRDQYALLEDILVVTDFRGERNFKAMEMRLGRIVDGMIRSAYGAANFYENKRQIAFDEKNSFSNESRDEDRMGVDGGENRVDRAVRFAAQQAPKAYALAVMATGACDAYRELFGEDWKPYVKDTGRRRRARRWCHPCRDPGRLKRPRPGPHMQKAVPWGTAFFVGWSDRAKMDTTAQARL